MVQRSMTAAVKALLCKIIDDTNAEAPRIPSAKHSRPLGFNNILDCLYRGHSDMPTELRAASPSVDAGLALRKFKRENEEKEEDWALTDAIATQVLSLIDKGHIRLVFSR